MNSTKTPKLKDILSMLVPPFPEDIVINRAQTTVSISTPTKPQDPDVIANAAAGQAGYDTISVFYEKKKLSNKVWVINDGPGTLFAVATADGQKWSGESEIFPKEFRAFTTVYELRVRSPDASTKYRVMEYEPGHVA